MAMTDKATSPNKHSSTLREQVGAFLPLGTMPLGFGCGPLGIGTSSSGADRLLRTAIECGVTYFDTARMYGWGAAEGILGKLSPRYRDRLIIASKAGILPPNRSWPRRVASRGVKLLHRTAPWTKQHITQPEVWKPQFGFFKVQEIARSLETSLKNLRTDYLDLFLLHECQLSDTDNPDLLYFLEKLKSQGKIRGFGIATGIEETVAIAEIRPSLTSVVQIPSNIWEHNTARLSPNAQALTIVHSCFGSRFGSLLNRLSSDDSLARDWTSMTQVDAHDTRTIAQLILAHAVHANAGGMVLFFSSRPAHIMTNVRGITDNVITPAQIEGLNAFVQNHFRVRNH